MSPLNLRPATVHALGVFRARRRRLLVWRAVLQIAVVTLTAFALVALMDRARWLPDGIRTWLSVAVYVGAAIVAWRASLNRIREARSDAGAASLLEQAVPDLREKVLSAVELASPGSSLQQRDSEEFRAQLQDRVAMEIQTVPWQAALPLRHLLPLARWLGLILLATLALSAVPMLHFPGFLARAFLPFVPLERPASVRIQILEPRTPHDLAAMVSTLPVIAEVTGSLEGHRVELEFEDRQGHRRSTEMALRLPQQFEARLQVGQEDLRYRVRAADGLTRWYDLEARARPRVTQFEKTLTPPAYIEAEPVSLAEEHGDLEVLEGSEVTLRLTTSETLSHANLLLNPGDPASPSPEPMSGAGPDLVSISFTATADLHSWSPQLTSADTGFENDSGGNPWRITVLPDSPPAVVLVEPEESLTLLPDESVRVRGWATDDVGLKQIELAHSTNAAEWVRIPQLDLDEGSREFRSEHILPLASLALRSGDAVLLKWIATDLKGQTAESQPVRVLIQSQTVDPRTRAWAAAQLALKRSAAALKEPAQEMREAVSQLQNELKRKNQPGVDSESARLQGAQQTSRQLADELWEQLKMAALQAPNELARAEVQLLGERVAQLRHSLLPQIESSLEAPAENLPRLGQASSQASSAASTLENATRLFSARTAAEIAAQSSEHLRRQQDLLTKGSLEANRDAAQKPRWEAQQQAAVDATRQVQEDLQQLSEQLQGNSFLRPVDESRKQLLEATADVQAALDPPKDEPSPEEMYTVADQLRNRLDRSAEQSRRAAADLQNRTQRLRQQLGKQTSPTLTALSRAHSALRQASSEARKPEQQSRLSREGQTAEQQAQQQLAEAAKQLQELADLRNAQALPSDRGPLDQNRLSRAVDQLAREVGEEGETAQDTTEQQVEAWTALAEKADQLDDVARLLRTEDELHQASQALARTAADPGEERASQRLPNAAADVRAAEEALERVASQLQRQKDSQPIAATARKAAQNADQSATRLNQAATQAQKDPGFEPPAVPQVETAARQAIEALDAFAPQAAQARASLQQLTPSLSQMMQQLAGDMNEAREQTQNAADQAEAEAPVIEVAAEAETLREEAAEGGDQIEALQAALRQEANQADLHEADQRQLARTADVALEQMRQTTPQIEQDLQQAAQAQKSQPQAQSLQAAADAQQQTAEALQQLSESFAQMEQGEALSEQQLAALQNMEQQLGVQEMLEDAYDRAEALADLEEMAQNNPSAALAALEQELQQNPGMQKALSEIGRGTAQQAEADFLEQSNQPSFLGQAAEEAAHRLERVARHENRLQQPEAAEALAGAADQLRQTAQKLMENPAMMSQDDRQQAAAAAQQGAQAAEAAAAATPPVFDNAMLAQVQATALAQALDQLDQTVFPQGAGQQQPGEQGQQQGEPGEGEQGQQQAAQQSLAEASESQQQSMAQSRNDGQVPGTPSQSQNLAQNEDPQASDGQSASEDGANMNPQGEMGVLAGEVIWVDGDWGHLPAHTAEALTEATRQEAPPEYRAAVENYYKAIANRARE